MADQVWFALPGDLETVTGGYVYARRLIRHLPAAGWTVHHVALPAAVDPAETQRRLAAIPPGSTVLVDGLAFGVLPPPLLDSLPLRWVALVHHPLALETGLDPATAARLRDSEKQALPAARRVIVTSPHTADSLIGDYGVPAERIDIALPGTDPVARAAGGGRPPRLLTVATLTRRKAHDVLLAALARIRDLAWQSRLVGSLGRDGEVVAEVRRTIARFGLEDRVVLVGELTGAALEKEYAAAEAFVLPSRHEGYGMAFAEALAHGLPVVACAAGAVPETVPAEAGLLVPVDDAEALAGALRRLLADARLRQRLGDAAWAHGRRLPTWDDTARAVGRALARVGP